MKKRSLNDIVQLIVLVIMIVTGSVATIVFLFDLKNHLPVSVATDEDLKLEEFLQIGGMLEDYLDVDFDSLLLLTVNPVYLDEEDNIYALDLVIAVQVNATFKSYSISYSNEQIWIRFLDAHQTLVDSALTLSHFLEIMRDVNIHWGSGEHILWYANMVYPQTFTTSGSANYVWMDGAFEVADDSMIGAFLKVSCAHSMQEMLDDQQVNYFVQLESN